MGIFYFIIRAWFWDYVLSLSPGLMRHLLVSLDTAKDQKFSQHDMTQSITKMPPELIFLILRNIPYRTRPQMDLFTSVVAPGYPLDVGVVAAPLVCSSWRGPGTQVLYEHITVYTGNQCRLLHRTLLRNPSLVRLIRGLRLPRHREAAIITPLPIIQMSVNLAKMCKTVQELDVIYQARDEILLNEFNLMAFCVMLQDDLPLGRSHFPYLRSLRVSISRSLTIRPVILSAPLVQCPGLQELTLNGFEFYAKEGNAGTVWSEFPQLVSLRLERCEFYDVDLGNILQRTTPKLRSLALFSVQRPFRKNEMPASLAESLMTLWIEDVWPLSFESYFTSCNVLQSLHLDWHLFAKMAPCSPQNLRHVSITVPCHVSRSAPNFYRFESEILRLSVVCPKLKTVHIQGLHGYPLLRDNTDLPMKLGLRAIDLILECVYRSEGLVYPHMLQ